MSLELALSKILGNGNKLFFCLCVSILKWNCIKVRVGLKTVMLTIHKFHPASLSRLNISQLGNPACDWINLTKKTELFYSEYLFLILIFIQNIITHALKFKWPFMIAYPWAYLKVWNIWSISLPNGQKITVDRDV